MTRKEAALKDIDIIVAELTGALTAARECRQAIVEENAAKLDEAVIRLDDIDLIDVTSGSMRAEIEAFWRRPLTSLSDAEFRRFVELRLKERGQYAELD